MNSHVNYVAVKARMDDLGRAAERARHARARDRDRSGGSRRGSLARALTRWRPSVPVERRPCIEE
jgi:hypothetical protein